MAVQSLVLYSYTNAHWCTSDIYVEHSIWSNKGLLTPEGGVAYLTVWTTNTNPLHFSNYVYYLQLQASTKLQTEFYFINKEMKKIIGINLFNSSKHQIFAY